MTRAVCFCNCQLKFVFGSTSDTSGFVFLQWGTRKQILQRFKIQSSLDMDVGDVNNYFCNDVNIYIPESRSMSLLSMFYMYMPTNILMTEELTQINRWDFRQSLMLRHVNFSNHLSWGFTIEEEVEKEK